MAIYKRKGSKVWQIEIKQGEHRIRRSSGTKNRRDAEELARRWEDELHGQLIMGRPINMTLGEAVDRYYTTVLLPKSNPRTAKRDRYALDRIKDALGEHTPLKLLTTPTIVNYRDNMLAEDKAPGTVNRHLASVRAVLNRAKHEWGALSTVPTFKLLPLDNMRHRWLTDDEELRLLKVSSPHLRDLIVFLVDTGARKGEALDLQWANVHLGHRLRPIVTFLNTKSKKPRSVPLTKRVATMLRELKKSKPDGEEHVLLYQPFHGGDRVPFGQPHGTWKTACKRAGIADIVMHDLRHTFASRLVMRGVPLLAVSHLLGHADIKMTQRYAHLSPSTYDDAISALEE